MTDVSGPDNVPPRGDRLVYVPLEALPKELLDKLGNFKVIVRDETTGDKIHPKERLGEVLAELNRDGGNAPGVSKREDICENSTPSKNRPRTQQPVSPDTTDDDFFRFNSSTSSLISSTRQKSRENKEDSLQTRKRMLEDDEVNLSRHFQKPESFPSYDAERNSLKSRYQTVYDNRSHVAVYAEPNDDSRMQTRVTMDTDRELQTFQTILETTPGKRVYNHMENIETPSRKSPRYDDAVAWDYARRSPYRREQPTPSDVLSSYRHTRHDDVVRARKQLFVSPRNPRDLRMYSYQDDIDPQKENCSQSAASPRPRDYPLYPYWAEIPVSPECSSRPPSEASPRRLKRKQVFAEDTEFITPYQKVESSGSGGTGERLLEMLNPSKRACYDYGDIGPSQSRDHHVNCACSMMESHFLQMTECAYRNIRRKDSSRESFEQFNRELTQTNSVLKESVNILRAIQQICSHKDQRMR
ncbi:uncharacterized protein LOC135462839 [Liolophura sinensis]|uniref:uncharacterized protein LOC135462839 n=1 Tax=Liolophura sinensis TaxID=3198878 RepID=UPI003158E9E9